MHRPSIPRQNHKKVNEKKTDTNESTVFSSYHCFDFLHVFMVIKVHSQVNAQVCALAGLHFEFLVFASWLVGGWATLKVSDNNYNPCLQYHSKVFVSCQIHVFQIRICRTKFGVGYRMVMSLFFIVVEMVTCKIDRELTLIPDHSELVESKESSHCN